MPADLGPLSDLANLLYDNLKDVLSPEIALLVVVGLVLLFILKHLGVGVLIGRAYRWLTTRKDRRRAMRRARFSDHVESQMRRIAEKEEWRDSRYAELEAELEITGRRRKLFRRASLSSLRRVPSLSKALEECKDRDDRIVLLEGEPGAGKSVAMRHLAQRMAHKAMRRASESSVIPIYVNLKTFRCSAKPTSEDVRAFVIDSINAVRDRDVERFLDDEFDRGKSEGTWLFLFDSFDEIPEILSATEADEVIEAYSDALHAFLHSMNRCRGIVASREFRGPGRKEWPIFRVVPLSEKRKKRLVKKAELQEAVENLLLAELPNAEAGVQQMSANPLFLGLLCEYMREGNGFPANVHAVLEAYIGHRLIRDAERMRGHFDVGVHDVRAVAEELAFMIADRQLLGLNVPKRQAVALLAETMQASSEHVVKAVDALIYTKIARTGDDEDSVTFSHRRLQEYFATCVVMREPDRVAVRTLLTSGRWRETAVTILQTHGTEQAAPLLAEAVALLPTEIPETTISGFAWPQGLLYLLGILAEGASPALLSSQPEIVRRVGLLLKGAWEAGRHFDRKWALEASSVADTDICHYLLVQAFSGDSEWLRQEAFSQVRKVPDLAIPLHREIRLTLFDLSVSGKLQRQKRSVQAQIQRLPNPAVFERALWMSRFGLHVYASMVVLAILVLALAPESHWGSGWPYAVGFLGAAMYLYFVVRLFACRKSAAIARLRSLAPWFEARETAALGMLPILVAVGFVMGWVLEVYEKDETRALVSAGAVSILAFWPAIYFFFVKNGVSNLWFDLWNVILVWWEDVRKKIIPLSFFLGYFGVVYIAGRLGAQTLMNILIFGLAVIIVLTMIGVLVFISVSRVRQQRKLRVFRRILDEGAPTLEVFRKNLLGLRMAAVASVIFSEMSQMSRTWPSEVIEYLHRVAKALETSDYASEDLPRRAKYCSWVRSSEVLDQLSIFLGAQRRKAEITPR